MENTINKFRVAVVIAVGFTLNACATTSFAPPSVNLVNKMETRGSNRSIGQSCQPFEVRGEEKKPIRIEQNVEGAQALIDNFLLLYRCRAHSAANGRQIFELPSFLVTVGTLTATALGAGPDVALSGGAAASILNGGKSYYSPKQKAEIFDGALDALICIKMEAAGISAFSFEESRASVAAVTVKRDADWDDRDKVPITIENQYFQLVSSSLFSVERVLAQRLSNAGTFDPDGVVAEIEQLAKKLEEAKGAEKTKEAGATAAVLSGSSGEKALVAQTLVQVGALKPKLQSCVVRAKL
jgi:hypothetical protein